jgi:hypothetical protein
METKRGMEVRTKQTPLDFKHLLLAGSPLWLTQGDGWLIILVWHTSRVQVFGMVL